MIRLIFRIVQLQPDDAGRSVVRAERLLRHDPNVSVLGHVVDGRVTEYYVRILLALDKCRK